MSPYASRMTHLLTLSAALLIQNLERNYLHVPSVALNALCFSIEFAHESGIALGLKCEANACVI